MSATLKVALIATALVGAPLGYVLVNVGVGSNAGNGNGSIHGAPGPIAGAGLPVLAVGAFWLFWRRRRKSD
jgi:LPXTG-motif cell wall-anchored protein